MLFLKKSKVIQIDFVTKSKKEYKKRVQRVQFWSTKSTPSTLENLYSQKKKCTLLYSKEYNLVTLTKVTKRESDEIV